MPFLFANECDAGEIAGVLDVEFGVGEQAAHGPAVKVAHLPEEANLDVLRDALFEDGNDSIVVGGFQLAGDSQGDERAAAFRQELIHRVVGLPKGSAADGWDICRRVSLVANRCQWSWPSPFL